MRAITQSNLPNSKCKDRGRHFIAQLNPLAEGNRLFHPELMPYVESIGAIFHMASEGVVL